MIVYIDIIPPKKGVINRIKSATFGFPPIVSRESFLGCGYMSVSIYPMRKKLIKRTLESLLPKDCVAVPSESFDFTLYGLKNVLSGCDELKARLLLNFLKSALTRVANGAKTRVLLIDKDGRAAPAAAELIPLCRVFVKTDRPENYGPCAEYCRLKYGEAPIISQKVTGLTAAFAPFGTDGFILPNSDTPIFSPVPGQGFCLKPTFADDFILAKFPKRADKAVFSEAFFENFCPDEILSACPKSLINQGFTADLNYFVNIFSA